MVLRFLVCQPQRSTRMASDARQAPRIEAAESPALRCAIYTRKSTAEGRHQVSLVSVTQHLNATASLGRLTFNILLSFAQFEREMISDRTRDKMAAARRKGKWVGGKPVLGYDVAANGGKLVVNPEEAGRV